jgi:ParB/RepB/Spo0J family partition protein
MTTVPITDIQVSDNVRSDLGDIEELTTSIKLHGVLVPITVTDDLRLIAGYRRLTAAQKAGLDQIPVHYIGQPDNVVVLQVVENAQRKDLAPTEYAQAFAALQSLGMTQRDIAAQVGLQQSNVSRKLALLKLSPRVAKMVDNGTLTERLAAEISKLTDFAVQEELASDPTEFRIQQAIDFQDRTKGSESLSKALSNAGIEVSDSTPSRHDLLGQYSSFEAFSNRDVAVDEVITIGVNFDGEPVIKVYVPGMRDAAVQDIVKKAQKLALVERGSQLRKAVAKAATKDVLLLAAHEMWERSTASTATARQVAKYLELDSDPYTKVTRSTNNDGEAIEVPVTDWVSMVRDFRDSGGRSAVQAVAALLVATGFTQPVLDWLTQSGVQDTEVLTEHFLQEMRDSSYQA